MVSYRAAERTAPTLAERRRSIVINSDESHRDSFRVFVRFWTTGHGLSKGEELAREDSKENRLDRVEVLNRGSRDLSEGILELWNEEEGRGIRFWFLKLNKTD